MRTGFDAMAENAKTPTQYIAADLALCLEQTGRLPSVEELVDILKNYNEEFTEKFPNCEVNDHTVYEWVLEILTRSCIKKF